MLLIVAGPDLAGAAVKRDQLPLVRSLQHVVICHALGNGGYNRVNPAVDNVVHEAGHSGHARDIIPPFDYVLSNGTTGHFPGLNWPEGEATWLNGCVRPAPPTGAIDVARKCVTLNDNGTFDATFGYQSSATGLVEVGVGPDNVLTPSTYDGQQVTMFTAGEEVPAAFTVNDIPNDTTLTWTVTYNGHTSSDSMTSADPVCGGEGPPPGGTIEPIGVFVTCVTNHGSTYDAQFGYDSQNTVVQAFPVSPANGFSPDPEDRGQPTMFLPGLHEDAVTVTGIPASEELTWTLAFKGTFEANASAAFSNKCSEPIEPPPTEPVPPPELPRPLGVFVSCVYNHAGTFDATFGYVNVNVGGVTIPVGTDNAIAPGAASQGQPETFLPGFLNAAFTVRGVSTSHAVTWTVRFGGKERVATATADFPRKCVTAPIDPVADAHVTKTAAPRRVKVGGRVRFTIDVRNTGSKVLRPAEATDTLPAGLLRIVSATSTLGGCHVTTAAGSRVVHCSATELAPGQSFTIHISAQAIASGSASDHAGVVGLPGSVASATVTISGRTPPTFTG